MWKTAPMKDLTSPWAIKLKGILFLFIGIFSAVQIIMLNPDWRAVALLVCCVWGFCRFYYFAFYVIEKYVDSSYRFAGLWDFAGYFLGRHKTKKQNAE